MSEVSIQIVPLGPLSWEGLASALEGKTGWQSNKTRVYSYAESIGACTLKQDTLQAEFNRLSPDVNALLEGRFFSEECDARWVRQANGTFRAWVTKEEPGGVLCLKSEPHRHYLIGTYKTKGDSATCEEDRYPGTLFDYPISEKPKDFARAYISVVEYAPALPSSWPPDDRRVEELLNQPAVIAHRFVGVGCGVDQELPKNNPPQPEGV